MSCEFGCGKTATTELSAGWDPVGNRPSFFQVCEECRQEEEAWGRAPRTQRDKEGCSLRLTVWRESLIVEWVPPPAEEAALFPDAWMRPFRKELTGPVVAAVEPLVATDRSREWWEEENDRWTDIASMVTAVEPELRDRFDYLDFVA